MYLTTRINRAYTTLLVITLSTALVAAVAWPHGARAEWRSLSGGFLPEFSDGATFAISPDSRTVAFIADKDVDDVKELYAVPVHGTTPVKLNPPLVSGGNVQSFQWTPDGAAVLYLAEQEVDNRVELYRVPVDGGDAVKLNAPLVAGGNVSSFKIDGTNERVVYVADQETNEIFELWSIAITGGGLFKLNGTLAPGGDIGLYEIDPLSDRVVYSADQETDGKYELYSVPILGGSPLKLNPPIALQGGGDSGIYSEFAVNQIIPVVVFVAREAASPGGKVYMIPTAGGLPLTQLSFNLLATQRILNVRISPTGDRVVFNVGTRQGSTNAFKGNLYSVLIGGGGAANLTETADPLYGADSFRFTPDGTHVIYNFQQNEASVPRLESSTTQFGVRATLYAPQASSPMLVSFAVSPDSAWVMYQVSSGGPESNIRTIPPTGGSPTNHGFGDYKLITPNSERIAYTRVVSDTLGTTELFSAQIFGGDERNLSGMNGTGYVGSVAVSEDGAWIVYTVQVDGRYDLRVSDGLPAQAPRYEVRLPVVIK
jgi:Tol biopolymer transport system component